MDMIGFRSENKRGFMVSKHMLYHCGRSALPLDPKGNLSHVPQQSRAAHFDQHCCLGHIGVPAPSLSLIQRGDSEKW
jgi:hypothetical protein